MSQSIVGGALDFENYWGEKLVSATIGHYTASIFNTDHRFNLDTVIRDIDDTTKIHDAFKFQFVLGSPDDLDYWTLKITTENNAQYATEGALRCSIRDEDRGRIILGVNGESKKMYISMVSGTCSAYLLRVG